MWYDELEGRSTALMPQKLAIGLDISDHSVEAVSLARRKGAVVLEAYGRAEIPPGVIHRGVILDQEKMARLLREFFTAVFGPDAGRLAVGLALPEQLAYAKIFSLPANLSREMAVKAAAIEAADSFPIPLADAVTCVSPLARRDGFQDYFFIAAERVAVQAYVTVIRRAGAEVKFIDLESLATARALVPAETEPTLIADIGAQTTLLAVTDGNGVTLSSNTPIAGDALTAAVEVQLNVPLEKAELMKRRAGFDPAAEKGRIFLILQKPMAEIIAELGRTLKYFERKTLKPVRRIVLAGGTSLLPGVVDYVASNFPQVTVAPGQPFRGVNLDPTNDADLIRYGVLFATATGLALRAAGLRDGPAADLQPAAPAGHGLTQFANFFKQAASALKTMAKAKTSSEKPKRSRAAKSALSPAEGAPPPAETPQPEPAEEAVELKKHADLQQAFAKLAEPEKATGPEAAKTEAEAAAVAESQVAQPATAEKEESDAFGRGIGEILGSEHDYGDKTEKGETEAVLQPLPEETHDHVGDESEAKPHLTIDAILSRGKQRLAAAQAGQSLPDDAEPPLVVSRPPREPRAPREPNRKLSVILLGLLVIILVAAAGGGIYMFAKKSGWNFSAAMNVVTSLIPKKGEAPAGEPVTAPGPQAPATVSVAFRLATTAQPAGDKPIIVTRAIETDVQVSGTFDASGSAATTAGRASGKLRIVNTTAEDYTFVATTRCLTSEGVLFRLKKAAAIPANGSVETEVAADEPGPQGDIGPTKFTIPGLPTDLQAKIWAESDAPMTGGSGAQVKAVSAEDLAAAKASLLEKLRPEAEANLAAMAAQTEFVLPELIDSRELSATAPAPGTVGQSFKLTLAVRFRVLLVPEDQVLPLLQDKLKQDLSPAESLADYELGQPQYAVEAFRPESDLAEIRVEASVSQP